MNPKLTTQDSEPIINALTIDVEDYFQVSAFEAVSPPSTWDERELRVEANTDRILGLLDTRGVKATFFVLGWVAERCPNLVRRIAGAGHELASHGYGHRRVYHQTREEFRADIRKGKAILEDLGGAPVLGYRAPSYSISRETMWAFDELLGAGFVYDSSVFPIRHDLYGMPDWPRFPFVVEKIDRAGETNWVPAEGALSQVLTGSESWVMSRELTQNSKLKTQDVSPTLSACPESRVVRGELTQGPVNTQNSEPIAGASGELTHNPQPKTRNSQRAARLLELPITTLRLLGRSWPISGGGYFRLFPYGFTRWGLRRINEIDGRPFVFYLHPWELDPGQPRMRGASPKSRFRHYLNLDKTEGRFGRLLGDFSFSPVRDVAFERSNRLVDQS